MTTVWTPLTSCGYRRVTTSPVPVCTSGTHLNCVLVPLRSIRTSRVRYWHRRYVVTCWPTRVSVCAPSCPVVSIPLRLPHWLRKRFPTLLPIPSAFPDDHPTSRPLPW